jgi:hypothetical protein
VRLPREPFFLPPAAGDAAFALRHLNPLKHVLLNRLACRAAPTLRRHGHLALGAFVGVLYTGRMTAPILARGLAALRRRGIEAAEALFHPADPGDPRDHPARGEVPAYYFVAERRRELESLLSPTLRAVLAAHGVEPVTHRRWAERRGLRV